MPLSAACKFDWVFPAITSVVCICARINFSKLESILIEPENILPDFDWTFAKPFANKDLCCSTSVYFLRITVGLDGDKLSNMFGKYTYFLPEWRLFIPLNDSTAKTDFGELCAVRLNSFLSRVNHCWQCLNGHSGQGWIKRSKWEGGDYFLLERKRPDRTI